MMFLPGLAKRIAHEAPGIRLITTAVSPDRGLEYIRDGRIDLLIAYFVVTKVPGNFRTRLLFRDSYRVLARRDHPQFRTRMTLEGFAQAGHVVVAPRDSWSPGPMDYALAQAGLKRDIRIMVPHYMVVPYVIAETDLIATVPARAAARMTRSLPIRSFRPPLEVRPRVWFNPELESRNYIVPGLIAVIMMVIAAMLTSLTFARECSNYRGLEIGSTVTGPARSLRTNGHLRFCVRTPSQNDLLLTHLAELMNSRPPT